MTHSEFELKLHVPAALARRLAQRLGREGAVVQQLQAHYFDTPAGTLAQQRAALRLRLEDGRWVQTLKSLPSGPGGGLRRFEHNVEVAEGGPLPAVDIARHAGTDEGRRLAGVLSAALAAGTPPLQAVSGTRVQRTCVTIRRPGGSVEVALDQGELLGGARRHAFAELEFESKAGDPAEVFALAAQWLQRHPGLWLDTVAKGQRAGWLAQGALFGPPVRARTPERLDAADPGRFLQQVVDGALTQVLANAGEVALGSPDPDHLHQLRVGLRRLRTVLRALGALSPRIDPDWEPVLAEALRTLGRLRDRDVLAAGIVPELARQGAPGLALPPPGTPWPDPAEVVTAAPLQGVLLALLAFTHAAADGASGVTPPRQALANALRRLHRSIARAADGFAGLDIAAQHRIRKRLKRLRYLAEFAAALYPRRAVARYLKALAPAQDALGRHNDEAVAREAFRQATATDPAAWFAVGWLTAQLDASSRRGAKALRRVRRAPRFWRKHR